MSFFIVKDIYEKRVAEGVRIRVIAGQKMTMGFFYLEPDAIVPEHSHPHEQMGTVLKGSVLLKLGGEERIVEEG
ncbi:MAG: cupin domain-containing protein, partial [Pseudomonadota bacterium]